jgi:hypothetical protein
MTSRAGSELIKQKGFIRPMIGKFSQREIQSGLGSDVRRRLLTMERLRQPFKSKRAAFIDGRPQAYIVDDKRTARRSYTKQRTEQMLTKYPFHYHQVM